MVAARHCFFATKIAKSVNKIFCFFIPSPSTDSTRALLIYLYGLTKQENVIALLQARCSYKYLCMYLRSAKIIDAVWLLKFSPTLGAKALEIVNSVWEHSGLSLQSIELF